MGAYGNDDDNATRLKPTLSFWKTLKVLYTAYQDIPYTLSD